MIQNINSELFKYYFPEDPHPFVSDGFIQLNSLKAGTVVRLVQDHEKKHMGLVAGIQNGILNSPFSAPFGGFHCKNENIYSGIIENFINELMVYATAKNFKNIKIILPPDIYNPSFNAKLVNILIRARFKMEIPDITNWVNLEQFNGVYNHPASRTYYNQSVRNNLAFQQVYELVEMKQIYDLIVENRARMGRPIFMSFNDLLETGKILPADYFKVINTKGELIAGAIFYRAHPKISFAVFWGDAENGRSERAMDYLVLQLWNFYKKLGYQYIDLGTSTEGGTPNEGLLRFKETHECVSAVRYTFKWK